MDVHFERRRAPRVHFRGATFVARGEHEILCTAENLSETGMLVFYPKPYSSTATRRDTHPPAKSARPKMAEPSPGEALVVTFALPNLKSWISLSARLVRNGTEHSRPAWGIEFVGISDVVRRVIRHFVERDHYAGYDEDTR